MAINQHIIAAISTPAGMGGIAVIRVSGYGSIALVDSVFQSPSHKKLVDQKGNTVLFGSFIYQGEIIDEVLVTVFKNPHSFTGEDSIEIACHGSVYIQQTILKTLIKIGATLATPGEFTQRAFLNGKMDLSQAESVADLIASQSSATHRLALNQMRGGFSQKLKDLRDQLLIFISLIELELDFSEEDVEFADRSNLQQLSREIKHHITKLASSFEVGNAIKQGIPVSIVGETNAGKSTLLNSLLNEDKAIVSNIHGTTRDVIEDTIILGGVLFRLIDTAGIRDTSDQIESIGIEKTFSKINEAQIVIWMIDIHTDSNEMEKLGQKLLSITSDKQVLLVFNKIDEATEEEQFRAEQILSSQFPNRLFISAKNHFNIDKLEAKLIEMSQIPNVGENDVIVTNIRHYEALTKAENAIDRVEEGLVLGIPTDFLAQDIRECMHYLGEITGEISTDEILGSIFSRFCIGK